MSDAGVVILVANRGFGIWSSRELLIRQLRARGHQVIAAAARDRCFPLLEDAGARVVDIPFREGGFNPFADASALHALLRLYRRERPVLVHHFNAKPIVYGGIAARLAGVRRVVATVTGAGYAFSSGSIAARAAVAAFRAGLYRTGIVIFQNHDDQQQFISSAIVTAERSRLIISSGVDVERFRPADTPPVHPTFLMVSRLLWQKGVGEYVEAAAQVRRQVPDVRFLLGGEEVPGRADAVPEAWIRAQVAAGTIEYLGYVSDMPEALRQCSVFVFPSRYREGVPRVLLEAAASGVPVLTLDSPGCREAVRDGQTGFLIPSGDMGALMRAMRTLVEDPGLSVRLGRAGREMVEREFVQGQVISRILECYDELAA